MQIFNLEAETHLTPCRKNVFAIVTIFIIVIAIYSNTLNASWHFDDETNILTNKPLHLKELNWQNIKKTFFASYDNVGKIYRPIACFSFALNYYFCKDNIFGYHIVNLSIHLIASIFLFLFIYHSLNLPLLKAKYGPNSYFIALLTTVLWSINPIQTQAITYIVQRMASMAGMFYIISMYFYLKARICKLNALKVTFYFFCFIAGILAFGTKENTVMLPFSIFFFDLFIIQGLTKENIKKNSLTFFILILIPVALALILKGPSILSTKHLFSAYEHRSFTMFERFLTEPRIILFYITLLLYPMPGRLCITHDIPISHNFINPPTTIIAIFTILIILGLAIMKSKKWPFISYCIIFFFINHLIESSILPLELIFEHRNYIPSMLFFAPIAIILLVATQHLSNKKNMQIVVPLFIILILVGQGHSSFMRNFIWKTEETLWMDAIDKNPKLPRPYHNLGRHYGNVGYKEKEIALYQHALTLERGVNAISHHMTHYNLALAYIEINQQEKAIENFKKAIEIAPGFYNAYNNLGVLMIKQGKYDEAFNNFIKALSYDNNNARAHTNLGFVLLKKGRLEEALIESKKALAAEENFSPAYYNLGVIYKYKKEFLKAKYYFRLALEKNKKNIMTRLHIIETLFLAQDEKSLNEFLSETVLIIPPEKLSSFIENISADNIPDDEIPNLDIILPLLGKAYIKRSRALQKYGYQYL
jgi:tetratricopeptide (TPR) repeat protein